MAMPCRCWRQVERLSGIADGLCASLEAAGSLAGMSCAAVDVALADAFGDPIVRFASGPVAKTTRCNAGALPAARIQEFET